MLGASQVGKSSLCAQFLSSEHINAYDKVGKSCGKLKRKNTNYKFSEDSVCKEVSVAVNEAETRIMFVDHQHGDMSVRRAIPLNDFKLHKLHKQFKGLNFTKGRI